MMSSTNSFIGLLCLSAILLTPEPFVDAFGLVPKNFERKPNCRLAGCSGNIQRNRNSQSSTATTTQLYQSSLVASPPPGIISTTRRSPPAVGVVTTSTTKATPASKQKQQPQKFTVIQRPTVEDEVIGTRPKIVSIESAEDYKAFLESNDDDGEERMAIVKFHASWCKSCQKFGEQYKRVAREIGDLEEVTDDDEGSSSTSSSSSDNNNLIRKGDLRMGEIEYGANTELCKSLGVTKLPAVHIYSSKGKLVDAFKCGPKKLPLLLDKLDMYMSMNPAEVDFEADMYEGAKLGDTVLEALNGEIMASASLL